MERSVIAAYYTRTNTLIILFGFALICFFIAGVRSYVFRDQRKRKERNLKGFEEMSRTWREHHSSEVAAGMSLYDLVDGKETTIVAHNEDQANRMYEQTKKYFEDNFDLWRNK